MNDYIAGFVDATITVDRKERPIPLRSRQVQINLAPTISQFNDLDGSDYLIRDAGLCLIEMELSEPYDDTMDFFSWRKDEISASGTKD
jgi:hypothetical protein